MTTASQSPAPTRAGGRPGRSLVIPMFDESARIGASIDVLAASALADHRLELILVDDGSADGTPEVAEKALATAGLAQGRVLRLGANRGKGAAVRAGMLEAEGEARLFVDADLCVSTDDIEAAFAALEDGADVVYGTRAHPGSRLDRSQPPMRVASGRAYNLLLRALGLTRERDTQCGLKGASAAAVAQVFEPLVTDRFAFDVEVLARAHRCGLRVEPLAVAWSHVDASRVRPLQDGVSMSLAALRLRRQLGREERAGSPAERAELLKGMDTDAIDAMARVERDHWWFRAKRELVLAELARHHVRGTVVDAGSGTGGLLEQLHWSGFASVGVELDERALRWSAGLEPRPVVARAPAEALPLRSSGAAAVVSLDVLEHLDDDVSGLRELSRVAGPDGLVVIVVPAYEWAWSEHDVRLGHRRRYDRATLRDAASAAGLDVVRCSHFHSWLTPVALVLRRTPAGRLLRGSAEEASFVHPWVSWALERVGTLERWCMRAADLPAGLSILLVARVPADQP